MTDRFTAKSRGFAFVTMNDGAQANAAMSALNGRELHGRTLTVNEARPREERPRPYREKISIVNSEKAIELEGTIMMVLPGTMFRVALANDHLVLAHISGKMRKRFIRLTIGDRVRMEMSPYDTAKARIVYRL